MSCDLGAKFIELARTLKRIMLRTNSLRGVEKFLRVISINLLSPFVYKSSERRDDFYFLYGGIGDVLTDFYLINRYTSECNQKITVLIPTEVYQMLHALQTNVSMIEYRANNLFTVVQTLNRLKPKGVNFVVHKLSLERIVVCMMLGMRSSHGYLKNQSTIYLNGTIVTKPIEINFNRYELVSYVLEKRYGPLERKKTSQRVNEFTSVGLMLTKSADRGASLHDNIDFWDSVLQGLSGSVKKCRDIFIFGEAYAIDTARYIEKRLLELGSSANLYNYVGEITLSKVFAMLPNLSHIIALDSGLSNMARFNEKPTLAVYTHTDPISFNWPSHESLYNKRYACMPCIRESNAPLDNYPVICNHDFRCKHSLIASDVTQAVRLFLERN